MLGISCYIHIHHCFHREGAQAFNNLSLWLVHALVMFVTDLYQVCAGLFSLGRHCLIRELEMHGKTTVLVTLLTPEQYERSSNQPCFQTPWTNRYQGT